MRIPVFSGAPVKMMESYQNELYAELRSRPQYNRWREHASAIASRGVPVMNAVAPTDRSERMQVEKGQRTHAPMTGTHTHEHAAFGAPSANSDGFHSHRHYHKGDSTHNPAGDSAHEHDEFEKNSYGTLRGDVRAQDAYGSGPSIAERARQRRESQWW